MQIIVGPILSQIQTDNPELLDALIKVFTVPIPGADHSPAYRSGHWDGKKRFIDAEGNFRSGLLDRVLETLKKIECSPNITYSYNTDVEILNHPIVKGWTMHDYQTRAIHDALRKKRGVIKAPTGSGKTLILAGLLKAFEGKKVLCLFNQKQLIHQTYEYLTKKAPKGVDLPGQGNFKVGVCFSDGYEYADILLCSVFSIERIIGTPMEHPDVLIVDECHEFCTGKFTSEVIAGFPSAKYRIGLTATIPSNLFKLYNLEGGLGPEITTVSTEELIKERKLAKPFIQLIPLEPRNSDHRDKLYPWVYSKYIIHNKVRNNTIKSIVEKIYKSNDKAKVLILVKNLEHGKILKGLIPDSDYLQGADDHSTRSKTIKSFQKDKESRTLIGTKVLQTGVNIPEITHFINAVGLDSEITTIQALGRALRITPECDKVNVYDFIDEVRFLERHSQKRRRAYKKEGHEIEILPKLEYDDP